MTTPNHQATVLDALRSSPVGPFLDLPLPQFPQPTTAAQLPPLAPFQAPQAAPAAAVPPPLPPNPLEALLQGHGIPALPGIDQLIKPLLDLASGFGSGVLGAVDPTQIFKQASSALDGALQLGQTGLKGLDQAWQSPAAQNAQAMGQSAQVSGDEVSKRGNDIAVVTRDAAATVERGNIKLAGIVQSFVATAVAAAPVIFTPPGQAMLMASAAEHVSQGLAVVAQTRGEMTTHTAHMAALSAPMGVPAGPAPVGPGQSPFAQASQAIDQSKPFIDSAKQGVEGVVQNVSGGAGNDPSSTYASGLGSGQSGAGGYGGSGSLGPASTHAAGSLGGGGGAGGIGGGLAALGSSAVGGLGSGSAGGGKSALGAGAPGSLAGGAPSGVAGGAPVGGTGTGPSGMGGMGGMMGGAGRGGANSDTEHNTPSYLNRPVNNSDVVGELPRVVSPVIGAADPDEFDDVHDDYLD